jgi:hypothetical protein
MHTGLLRKKKEGLVEIKKRDDEICLIKQTPLSKEMYREFNVNGIKEKVWARQDAYTLTTRITCPKQSIT